MAYKAAFSSFAWLAEHGAGKGEKSGTAKLENRVAIKKEERLSFYLFLSLPSSELVTPLAHIYHFHAALAYYIAEALLSSPLSLSLSYSRVSVHSHFQGAHAGGTRFHVFLPR